MPKEQFDKLPITDVEISPEPTTKTDDFEFKTSPDTTATDGVSQVTYKFTVQKVNEESALVSLDIGGEFDTYSVTIQGADGEVRGPLAVSSYCL